MTSSIADPKNDPSLSGRASTPQAQSAGRGGPEPDAEFEPAVAQPASEPDAEAFLDFQETVISKRPPLPVPLSDQPPVAALRAGPKELGESLVGTNLEHFELKEYVGGGGMGAVFRATDTRLGRTVAVKVLLHESTDEETQRRFENEAQNAARLDHENIARVYHVGEDRGLHFIVFEFIDGINIRDLVHEKGPLPLGEAISYVLQVAEALQHASERGVVHRDIKPSNVLITATGRAKLVDMGLARLHHMESDSEDLTASGVTLGTFDYISPEQARDPRLADVRSDLYSLGCTLYFMLTGRPPFPEGTVLQKLLRHSSEEPSDPRLVRPDLDEELLRIVNKLLAKQPADRYQQPRELIGELLLVARRLNLETGLPAGTVWVAQRRSRFRFVLRALPWLVPLVLLVLGAWALDRGSGRSEAVDFGKLPVRLAPPETPPAPRGSSDTAAAEAAAARPGGREVESKPAEPPASPAEPVDEKPLVEARPAPVRAEPKSQTRAGEAETAPKPEPSASKPSPKPTASTKEDLPRVSESASQPAGQAPPAATGPEPEEEGSARGDSGQPDPGQPSAQSLVVAPRGTPLAAGALRFDSLADACRAAAQRGIATIELRFNGTLEEQAFDLAAENLTIRNADGFQPTIVFRPSFEDLATDRQMIRMKGGSLTWQGVHLRLELPEHPADTWSLFQLKHIISLQVRDAVITVRNVDAGGRPIQQRVAIFEIENGTNLGLLATADDTPRFIPPRVSLTGCVARGQTTVVHAEEATPFRLALEQCLVVTPWRLVDVDGAYLKPRLADGRIDVVMKHVTAVMGQGFCRLSSGPGAPYQLDLVTDCRDSILFVTDPEGALIERCGVREIGQLEKRLYVRGRDNFYPGSMTLLRINPSGDPTWYQDYDFEQRDEPWYQEESPRFTLMWRGLPAPGRTADQQTAADYALDPSENNPAYDLSAGSTAGADPAQLPAVPTEPAEPAANP